MLEQWSLGIAVARLGIPFAEVGDREHAFAWQNERRAGAVVYHYGNRHFRNALSAGKVRPPSYRSWVGIAGLYDLLGALQFNLLVMLGMREAHSLLDIGCGSLRGGRFAIMYLREGNYFGIEPESWLVEEGVRQNLGAELAAMKKPSFLYDSEFSAAKFNRKFDYIIAHSIFSHAAPAQIERCFSQTAESMHSGSIFLATYNRGNCDYSGSKWKYPSVAYTESSLFEMAAKHGLSAKSLNYYHPGGQSWVLFALRNSRARLENLVSRRIAQRLI
jgi:hypothetical protein